MALIAFLFLSLLLHGALVCVGEFVCEELPSDLCAYSISSTGKRCTLENFASNYGTIKYQCETSQVAVYTMKEWIETDECINACGVGRNTVDISSDSLLHPQFLLKLCSDPCYLRCPNIVDLYHNLALAEGNYLPKICANPHRAMYETRSSGEAAPGPVYDRALYETRSSGEAALGPVYGRALYETRSSGVAAPAPGLVYDRALYEARSSGEAAPGPVYGQALAVDIAPAPSFSVA